jgi:hypothetical protein
MSIKANELPELIAAAVKKAIADKRITDQSLAAMAHHPITIGIIAAPKIEKAAASESNAARPIQTMGYRLVNLDALRDTAELKDSEEK